MNNDKVNAGKYKRLYLRLNSQKKLVFVSICFLYFLFGCQESKYSQCKQIFDIVDNITKETKKISETSPAESTELKLWLTAANIMERRANQIMALKISNGKLLEYRHKLATTYRIYSQATYDAVKARENKNITVLKAARRDAEAAGTMQQNLIREMNTYCVD